MMGLLRHGEAPAENGRTQLELWHARSNQRDMYMTAVFGDIKTGIDILRQFIVPRAFTLRLVEFAEQEGILSVIKEMKSFTREEFCDRAAGQLKYKTGDSARKRMLFILLDFL